MSDAEIADALDLAVASGDDTRVRDILLRESRLPGPRLNLGLLNEFADAVAAMTTRPDALGDALAELLDGWAALSVDEAPGDQPEVVLPCAAVAAYGAVAAIRPDWWDHEVGKLRLAASDPRWRVREVVALAVQRLLATDWDRTVSAMHRWAASDDPLVVRAAAAVGPVRARLPR